MDDQKVCSVPNIYPYWYILFPKQGEIWTFLSSCVQIWHTYFLQPWIYSQMWNITYTSPNLIYGNKGQKRVDTIRIRCSLFALTSSHHCNVSESACATLRSVEFMQSICMPSTSSSPFPCFASHELFCQLMQCFGWLLLGAIYTEDQVFMMSKVPGTCSQNFRFCPLLSTRYRADEAMRKQKFSRKEAQNHWHHKYLDPCIFIQRTCIRWWSNWGHAKQGNGGLLSSANKYPIRHEWIMPRLT